MTLDTKHGVPDALQEQAALYALGVLEPEEARRFELHLAEGCATCEAEVHAFRVVIADLGHAVTPVRPRPTARERILARVRAGAPVPGQVLVRASESDWEAGRVAGLMVRRLHRDPATRRVTTLVRMAPGAGYPAHAHAGTEELYLLSGELHLGDIRLRAGDYCAGTPGSRHVASVSSTGCTFVVHASEDDRLGDDAPGSTEGIAVVHAGDGAWQPGVAAGVSYRLLWEDAGHGTRTTLVRMVPGAVFPAHRHDVAEQVYFLEGNGRVAGELLGPGDYYRVPEGTAHEPSTTEQGCTFLVIAARNEVLA